MPRQVLIRFVMIAKKYPYYLDNVACPCWMLPLIKLLHLSLSGVVSFLPAMGADDLDCPEDEQVLRQSMRLQGTAMDSAPRSRLTNRQQTPAFPVSSASMGGQQWKRG